MDKNSIINHIIKHKIIVIIRNIYGKELYSLVKALSEGGIKLVEVTFNQNNPDSWDKTAQSIKYISEEFADDILPGAGTVLTKEQVDLAKAAGARYIISPNVNKEVIKYTKEQNLVSIPGASTSTEIINADLYGADFVKLFPAGTLGLKYAKDLLAPISHVKMVATAGITPDNMKEFIDIGYIGVGISSYLANKNLIQNKDYDAITKRSRKIVELINKK